MTTLCMMKCSKEAKEWTGLHVNSLRDDCVVDWLARIFRVQIAHGEVPGIPV